jgi:predicted Zn-dependent protease
VNSDVQQQLKEAKQQVVLAQVKEATGDAWREYRQVAEALTVAGVPKRILGDLDDAVNNVFVDTAFETMGAMELSSVQATGKDNDR